MDTYAQSHPELSRFTYSAPTADAYAKVKAAYDADRMVKDESNSIWWELKARRLADDYCTIDAENKRLRARVLELEKAADATAARAAYAYQQAFDAEVNAAESFASEAFAAGAFV